MGIQRKVTNRNRTGVRVKTYSMGGGSKRAVRNENRINPSD